MANYNLLSDEVVLYEGSVTSNRHKGSIKVTLTSLKLIFEREKGLFKKEIELLEIMALDTIKVHNDAAQIKQKGNTVEIQAVLANFTLTFTGMLEAKKFAGKAIDAVTGTTLAQRSSDKIKGAFNMVDDTLGLDTRGAIRGILENGVKGAILNGIGKKK